MLMINNDLETRHETEIANHLLWLKHFCSVSYNWHYYSYKVYSSMKILVAAHLA